MTEWFVATLRGHPEIAIFIALGIGYWFGGKSFKGISLGAVTSTLIVAVIIGQLDIQVSANVKTIFFLLFLFAVGYGVGPQFVRGIAKDGLPQALFAAVLCVLCLGTAYIAARLAGYDLGYSAGLYAGSQTISASMGLATDAINRLGKSADQTKQLLDAMPIAYAVTYIFGTIGSAVLLAKIGPALLRIDLAAECRRFEQQMGESGPQDQPGGGWHKFELRAYRVRQGGRFVGLTAADAEQPRAARHAAVHRTHPARRRDHRRHLAHGARRRRHRRGGGPARSAGGRAREERRGGRRPGAAGDPAGRRRRAGHAQADRRHDARTGRAAAGSARHLPQQDHPRRHRHQHSGAAADDRSTAATFSRWSAAPATSPAPPRCSAMPTRPATSPTSPSSAAPSPSAR